MNSRLNGCKISHVIIIMMMVMIMICFWNAIIVDVDATTTTTTSRTTTSPPPRLRIPKPPTQSIQQRRRILQQQEEEEDNGIRKILPFTVELVKDTTPLANLVAGEVVGPFPFIETTQTRATLENKIRSYFSSTTTTTTTENTFRVTYAALTRVVKNTAIVSSASTITYQISFEGAVYFDVSSPDLSTTTTMIPTESQLLELIVTQVLTPTVVSDSLTNTIPSIVSAQLVGVTTSSPTAIPTVTPPTISPTIRPTTAAVEPTIPPTTAVSATTNPTTTTTSTNTESPSDVPQPPPSPQIPPPSLAPTVANLQTLSPINLEVTSQQHQESNDQTSSSGLIGGILGGSIILLILIITLMIVRRRRKSRRDPRKDSVIDDEDDIDIDDDADFTGTNQWRWKSATTTGVSTTNAAVGVTTADNSSSSPTTTRQPSSSPGTQDGSKPVIQQQQQQQQSNSPSGKTTSTTCNDEHSPGRNRSSISSPSSSPSHNTDSTSKESVSIFGYLSSLFVRSSTMIHNEDTTNSNNNNNNTTNKSKSSITSPEGDRKVRELDSITPELLRDDLSSIHSSDDEAVIGSSRNVHSSSTAYNEDDGHGYGYGYGHDYESGGDLSDFDDTVSIQPHDMKPMSSLHRPIHDYVLKKDMLESPVTKTNPIHVRDSNMVSDNRRGFMNDNNNLYSQYNDDDVEENDDDDETNKSSMIPSHYFRQPYHSSDDIFPKPDQFSCGGLTPTSMSAPTVRADKSERSQSILTGQQRHSSLSITTNTLDCSNGQNSQQSTTKSMLPKFSQSWWAARASSMQSRNIVDGGVRERKEVSLATSTSSAAARAATTSDIESDGENTTFRAASSDGWDPNDSHISGTMGTYDDGFVIYNGIGDVGQPKQSSSLSPPPPPSSSTPIGSYFDDDAFPSLKSSSRPKSLLAGQFAMPNEESGTDDDARPDWRKDLLGYESDIA